MSHCYACETGLVDGTQRARSSCRRRKEYADHHTACTDQQQSARAVLSGRPCVCRRELVRSETLRETSARGLRYQLGRKVHTCCAAACLDEGRLCQTSAVAPHLIDVDSGRAMRTADVENNEGSRPSSRSGVFEALGRQAEELITNITRTLAIRRIASIVLFRLAWPSLSS